MGKDIKLDELFCTFFLDIFFFPVFFAVVEVIIIAIVEAAGWSIIRLGQ